MHFLRNISVLFSILLAVGCSQPSEPNGEEDSSGWELPEPGRAKAEDGDGQQKLRFGSLAAGPSYTCGITRDSSLICWGRDDHGEASPPAGEFTFVSAGLKHACALERDGTARCWGDDTADETKAPEAKFSQISTARYHTCAVRKADGTLDCWGHGSNPEVDEGSIVATDDADQAVPPSGIFTQVVTGDEFSCGLRANGEAECWGHHVEYWDEDKFEGPYVQLDAGPEKVCGVRDEDKGITCWPLGYGEADAPSGEYVQVSVNQYHVCALQVDQTIRCWGAGSEPDVQQEGPYDFDQALPPEGRFQEVSSGKFHSCAVKDDGTISCWGRDHNGETNPPDSFTTGSPDDEVRTLCQRACRNALERCVPEEERASADLADCEDQCEELASADQRQCVINATTCEDARDCTG
jgi:alpha-tubulin suppressor-like RCC1 family protein